MKKLTQKEYNNIHSDFKSIREDGTYSILENKNGETLSIPVEIISEEERKILIEKLLDSIYFLVDSYKPGMEFAFNLLEDGTLLSWQTKFIEYKFDLNKSFEEQTEELKNELINKIKKG